MAMNLSNFCEIVKDREVFAAVQGISKSGPQLWNWTTTNKKIFIMKLILNYFKKKEIYLVDIFNFFKYYYYFPRIFV